MSCRQAAFCFRKFGFIPNPTPGPLLHRHTITTHHWREIIMVKGGFFAPSSYQGWGVGQQSPLYSLQGHLHILSFATFRTGNWVWSDCCWLPCPAKCPMLLPWHWTLGRSKTQCSPWQAWQVDELPEGQGAADFEQSEVLLPSAKGLPLDKWT